MKKFLAILLAMLMALCAVSACAEAVNPDDIEDNMTSADGKYVVAFVTDVGQLKDKSFNQGTWNGVKAYASANSLSYKYYQPANGDQATDDDRYDAMKAAVDGGAQVVVCAGFMQEAALRKAAAEFADVKFIFIDGYPIDLDNVAPISFKEEQSGFLAGYAVVKEGFTKLGFTGGGAGTNPACCRFGYGFAQGVNAAAKEMDINVELKYSWEYGSSFQASTELQTMISGWYESGTEIVFACGGSIYSSAGEAAAKVNGKVIGVDTDQSGIIDGKYGEGMTVTSAMKGLYPATYDTLTDVVVNGNWDKYVGQIATLGLISGTDPEANYVQIPMTTQFEDGKFTADDYKALVAAMFDGSLTVSNDISKIASDFATVITLDDQGSIK